MTSTTTNTEHDPNAPGKVALPVIQVVRLLGVPLHAITGTQTLDHIATQLHQGNGGWVITINLDILRRMTSEADTRALCDQATLCVADGMPLVWASKLQGTSLPERVTGSDLILSLNERAAREGFCVFLLGGDILEDGSQVATQAAEALRKRYPNIKIVGAESPKYGFDKDATYVDAMIKRVADARPDIVFVAVGFPKQERVIAMLRPALPKAWFLGVGISFSFVTGGVQRAPKFLQRVGLEWVHRFVQEPGRLFKRYFVHGIPFAIVLLARSALGRFATR